jgi:PGF-pre-PGF domain-containing protein
VTYKGDAWPSGSKAIIDGSDDVINWTKCSSSQECGGNANWNNIYYANISNDTNIITSNMYQNEMPLTLSQHPNPSNAFEINVRQSNWINVSMSNFTNTTVRDSKFSFFGGINLTQSSYLVIADGSDVYIRKINYFNESSSTANFSSFNFQQTDDPMFYSILNSLNSNVFDSEGEYYINDTQDVNGKYKAYIWPLGNISPISANITVSTRPGVYLRNTANYVTIDGFIIRKTTNSAVSSSTSTSRYGFNLFNSNIFGLRTEDTVSAAVHIIGNDTVIIGNSIIDIGNTRGIMLTGPNNVIIKNNNLSNIGATSIYIDSAVNVRIINNTILDSYGSHSNGISPYSCKNVLVADNFVYNTVRPFTFTSTSNLTVINNIFDCNYQHSQVFAEWSPSLSTGNINILNNIIRGSDNNCSLTTVGSGTNAKYLIMNNIIQGGNSVYTNNVSKDYNIYTALCWDQQVSNFSIHEINITENLIIDGNYNLISNSYGIDHGINILSNISRESSYFQDYNFSLDRFKIQRPIDGDNNGTSEWDIGPYEYIPESSNQSTSLSIFSSANFTTVYANQTIWFYANYTNNSVFISGATCNITFNDTASSWIMSQSSSLYNFSRNFTSAGIYRWNVSCNASGYPTLNVSDLVNISANLSETIPPSLTIYSPINFSYNTTNIMINFTASDASGIDKMWFNNETANVTYTVPIIMLMSQGNHRFVFFVNDSYGNLNTTNVSFFVDSIIPVINFTTPTMAAGNYSQNFITVNISVSDTNLNVFTIYLYNTTGISRQNSTSTFVNFTALPAGIYYINATANDTIGNKNQTATRTVLLDTTAPAFTNISNLTASDLSGIFYDINASDNLVGVSCFSINDSTNFAINCAGILTNASHLTPVVYSLNVTANDTLNNKNSQIIFINITSGDTIAPVLIVNSPLNISYTTNNITINLTASDNFILGSVWFNNESANITYTIPITMLVSQGNHRFSFFANDSYRNLNTTNVSFFIDSIIPSINFTAPTIGTGNYSQSFITVNISVSDTNLNTFTIFLFNQTGLRQNNSTSTFVNFTGLPDGVYYFNATANDTLNNKNQTSIRAVLLDTTAPIFTDIANITQMDSIPIYYDINATDSGVGVSCFSINSSSQFSINCAGILTNTSYVGIGFFQINVTVNDTLGNKRSQIIAVNTTSSDNIVPTLNVYSPQNISYSTNSILINLSANDNYLLGSIWFNNETNNIAYSSPISVIVSQGNHKFAFFTNDSYGNLNTTNISFFVDSIIPSINFTAPTMQSGNYSQNFIKVNISVSDTNLNTYTIFLFNTTGLRTTNSTAMFVNFTNLPDGIYFINASTNDTLNNKNDTPTRTILLDTTAPLMTVSNVSILDNQSLNSNIIATDNLTGVNCFSINDTTNFIMNCSGNLKNATGLSIRQYWLNVTVNDSLNNQRSRLIFINVTSSDLIAPILTINSPSNQTYNLTNISINVSVTDIHADKIWYFNGTNNVTYQNPTSIIVTQGGHTLIFYANDTYGNLNITAISFFTDSIIPSVSFAPDSISEGNYSRNYIYANISSIETNPDKLIISLFNETGALIRQNVTSSKVNFTLLADGIYYINATLNDTAGNNNQTETRRILLDTTAPTINNAANLTVIENQSWSYILNINDLLIGFDKITVNDSVNFQVSQTGNFTNKSYHTNGQFFYVKITVNDTLNNQRNYTFTVNVTFPDVVGPTITIISPSNSSYTTNNITVSLSVFDTSGVSKTWYSNGTDNRTYTTDQTILVNQGSNTLIFYSNDTLGNNNSINITFNVDSIFPAVNFTAPTASNGNYSRNYIEINVTSSDTNLETTAIYLYNSSGLIAQNRTNKFINITNIVDGIYYFNATANDTFGNNNKTETRIIILDTTAPLFTAISNITIQKYKSINYDINVTDNIVGADCFTINDTGNFKISCIGILENNTFLSNGTYALNITINDTLNNKRSQIIFINVTEPIDGSYPVVTVFSPLQNASYSTSSVIISFTASDDVLIDKLWYFNGATNVSYTTSVTLTLPNAVYNFRFYANDSSGNINYTDVSFTISYTAPVVNPPKSSGGGSAGAPMVPIKPTIKDVFIQNESKYETIDFVNITMNTSVTPKITVTEKENTACVMANGDIVLGCLETSSNVNKSSYKNVLISMKVENSWINNEDINVSTIRINQLDNGWIPLDTTLFGSNSKYQYFKANANYLSSFALTGKKNINESVKANAKADEPVVKEEIKNETIMEPKEETRAPNNKSSPLIRSLIIFGVLGIIVSLGALATIFLHKKQKVHLEAQNNHLRTMQELVNILRNIKDTAKTDIDKAYEMYEDARVVYETLDNSVKQNYYKYLLGVHEYLAAVKKANKSSVNNNVAPQQPVIKINVSDTKWGFSKENPDDDKKNNI